MSEALRRPDPSECAPYYQTYIRAVPEGNLLDLLREQRDDLTQILEHIPASREDFRYAPDKWSIRELLGHIVDTERVFAFRLLHAARAQTTALPGMDQDEFAAASGYTTRALSKIGDEYGHQRAATLSLLDSLEAKMFDRIGNASGFDFSVRALAYIICGHDRHHQKVLRERYLG